MPIATGVAKVVAQKLESTWGVAAGQASGKQLRRVTSDLSLAKATYESNEIRTDYQVGDYRHGVRSVTGSVNGELSPGSYEDFMAAAIRRTFTAVASVTGLSLTVALVSGFTYTITRGSGDFLTTGVIKVGMIIRATAALNALSLNKNLFVLAITTTVITVLVLNQTALTVEGPIAAVTLAIPGMKTFAPQTGHTDQSFSIEHWHADVTQSELFLGCKVQQQDWALPATGMATIKTTFMGKTLASVTERGAIAVTAQYFTTPAALGTSGVLAAVNGAVMAGGVQVALITGVTFSIAGNQTAEAVVGSNVYPDIQEGRIRVTGQMTVLFQDGTFRDYFDQETEVAIAFAFVTSNAASAEFIAVSFPRIKAGGAAKDDGEKAIIQTIPFQALIPINGGSTFDHEQSTIAIQDSLAV